MTSRIASSSSTTMCAWSFPPSPPSPAKDYRAEAIFTPTADGGTDFVWRGSFTEGVRGTGPIMRAIFGGAIRLFSAQLVKAAEREHRKGISFPK